MTIKNIFTWRKKQLKKQLVEEVQYTAAVNLWRQAAKVQKKFLFPHNFFIISNELIIFFLFSKNIYFIGAGSE